MTELILSDITVMGEGYCVIGLERTGPVSFRSVRPFPPKTYAWREPFPYCRGNCVRIHPLATVATPPHVEDRQSRGLGSIMGSLGENELVECLRKAEVSPDLEKLFGCQVQTSSQGGQAVWVSPQDAKRSICGCEYSNIRFQIFQGPDGFTLRAEMVLASDERLKSIAIVDLEWRRFVSELLVRIQRSDPRPLAERFLNWSVRNKLFAAPHRFARIGLPRPRSDRQCWLMLDSLFPQPKKSWLDEL